MKFNSPIVIVEDDEEDREFLRIAFKQLNVTSEILFFYDCVEAMSYLNNGIQSPFIILCDVNLPKMSGIEFKQRIDADLNLRKKGIPFIFYTTAPNPAIINLVYRQMSIQGFFRKGNDAKENLNTLKVILDYWSYCKHPQSLN
jgi:CheY-like chemotaxis protein